MTAVIIIAAIALLIFFLLASFVTADLEYDGIFKYKIKYLCFTLSKKPLSPEEEKKKKLKAEKKKQKNEKKELKEKAKRDKLLAKKRKARNKTAAAAKSTEAVKPEAESEKNTDTEASAKTSSQPDTDTKKVKSDSKDKSEKEDKADKPKITPELIFGIFGKAKPHIKRIFKKIRISRVYIDATIGGEDATKTAISYGVHCAAIDGLIAFLDSMFAFKAEKIDIRADFQLEKSVYYCRARVKLRLSTLLHSGIWGTLAVIGELNKVSDVTETDENKKSPQKAA